MWKNDSTEYKPNINPEGCFYSGFLKDEPSSKVVVSLCNGIVSIYIYYMINKENLDNAN